MVLEPCRCWILVEQNIVLCVWHLTVCRLTKSGNVMFHLEPMQTSKFEKDLAITNIFFETT